MRVEFTVDISNSEALEAMGREGRIDRSRLVDLAWAAESAGIDRLLIGDGGGTRDTIPVASYFLHATAALGVEVEHRAGLLAPEAAALQIATLDQLSGGRVTVRLMPQGGEASSHQESFARLDEYAVLLKRLWANDKPIDFEGRFHRLEAAFSGTKPFSDSVPIAIAGASGTAVKVAARHADIVLLPATSTAEIRRTIERVRQAAAGHRRADAVRFALPVRLIAEENVASMNGHESGRFARVGSGWSSPKSVRPRSAHQVSAVTLAGSPEKLALALSDYAEAGVTDFIVVGLRTAHEISNFGGGIVSQVRSAFAQRDGLRNEGWRPGYMRSVFARSTRQPA